MNLLLSLARNHKNSLVRDLAGRIMFNLGKHVANRTRLYKAELRHKAREARRDMVEAGAGRWVMVWDDGSLGDAKSGAVDETAADDGAQPARAVPVATAPRVAEDVATLAQLQRDMDDSDDAAPAQIAEPPGR